MNGNSGEAKQEFEFPQPAQGYEAIQEKSKESRPAHESALGKQQQPATSNPNPPITIPMQTVVSDDSLSADPDPIADGQGVMPTVSSYQADDTDRIEKEWVDRAKAIVAHTQEDPFEQKREMSRVKAEYIQKRFNKSIPSDDAVTA